MFFSAKRWDRRNRADLIESTTPCYDAQVVGSYRAELQKVVDLPPNLGCKVSTFLILTVCRNSTRDATHQESFSLISHDMYIRTRTEKFKSTFYPHCLSEWNVLETETRLAPSVAIFKKKM